MKHTIELDMFQTKITIIVGAKKYQNHMKKKYKIDTKLTNYALCMELNNDKSHDIVIGIQKADVVAIKEMLVHELVHAVTYLKDWYGINDDEFRAYLMQHLYTSTVKELDRIERVKRINND